MSPWFEVVAGIMGAAILGNNFFLTLKVSKILWILENGRPKDAGRP